jgi:ABC-type transport system involved in cytochrome bd biosynthesis fused ATPase/permease subunit
MSAVALTIGAAALAPMAPYLLLLVVVLLLPLLFDRLTESPWQRMMRERRRHAERTARTMRRMSEIRRQTLARMDRAERGRRR